MSIISLLLLSLPLAFTAFLFEALPRLKNRLFGVDIWTHLLYLKEYQRQKGIPKKIENGFLVPGEYDYPPVFIVILSKFPFKLVEKYEFLFSPFFDFLHLILIFIATYFLTTNILLAFLTQILYVLTPIIVLENSSATPRSLGYMLFSILLLSLFSFTLGGSIYLILVALLSGTLIFLSHRFTAQGFLFFSIFFTLFEKNLIYLFVFVGSFFLSMLLSRGFYLKVLRGHIGNLSFWNKNIRYRFAHQVKGNYGEYKTKDFIFKLYNQFLKFPPFVLTITNPWTLSLFFVFSFTFPVEPIFQKLVWWSVFSYILALCTIWIEKLRFLGEGQRYLELSAFPVALLSAKLLADLLSTSLRDVAIAYHIIVGVCALITIIVIQRKGIIKDRLRTITPSLGNMFKYLRSLKTKPSLLCIPHQITTNTIYHTGCPVFVNADYKNIEKISDVYPYIKRPIPEIMKKYNLDMILLNQDYAQISDLKLTNYKIIKQYENFILLQIA